QPVDMAVIVSPPTTVSEVLAECGRAGVKAAVIITAGFSEAGNSTAEAELSRVAAQYGIRFTGPNCAGLANTSHHLFPTLETHPPAGNVAIIAQSGAVGGVLTAWAKEFGLGISKFVSYGNGADLNEIDFLHYLAGDAETRVVALYIESASAGPAFMDALRACSARKPVVVIKSGRTQSGRRATLSHTGSMAGTDAVYDAVLRQCGAIRVHSIEEMFDVCKGFAYIPHLSGRRVAIVTNSGGPGVLAADRAEEVGLEVAEPGPAVQKKLAFLPPQCALKNPIDLTVEGTEHGYRETLLAMAGEYDAILALNIAPAYLDSIPLARGVCEAAQQTATPIVAAFLPQQIVTGAAAYLQAHDVPNFATGERAVAALAQIAAYSAAKRRVTAPSPVKFPAASTPTAALPALEPEAMRWLRENNIPVPEFRFANTCLLAVAGSREIGYPVVMKVVSPEILHKSEHGGVILDIDSDPAARDAFEMLQRAAEGKDFRGVIITPMIRDAQEVLLGLSRDPQFGPVVAFGLGGIYTEVWRDIVLRVAPLDHDEAARMIREIQSFPLLAGIRGQPPRDLDALAEVLVTFSQLPFRYPQIGELDLNPVFVLNKGVLVGDVRVIQRNEDLTADERR
ncbi:MAG: acetate--CoA ligase family protein, partial [Anaerolineae bacterium]|nr:acetate--CoA ligase family protein [Anaerolineae bacterium]